MQHVDILNRYPWQFHAGREIDHSIPDHWLPAIDALCASVNELVAPDEWEQFYWRDIKEKHGVLSVNFVGPGHLADAIEMLVDIAESACRDAGP